MGSLLLLVLLLFCVLVIASVFGLLVGVGCALISGFPWVAGVFTRLRSVGGFGCLAS